ncbi:MAG: tyrosine-type recombinase/integrase [Solirubrobacteraceae bacterium]
MARTAATLAAPAQATDRRAVRAITTRPPSGHVYRVERKRGAVWYAKYRLPDGRQVQRKLGPAWGERGRPPAGYFTKRTAEDWLRDTLDEARRGTLGGMVVTGATFEDAFAEFLRYAEQDRQLKPSTLRGYRSIMDAHLLPAFKGRALEKITSAEIERWRSELTRIPRHKKQDKDEKLAGNSAGAAKQQSPLTNNSKNHIVLLLHGVFARACKVYGLPVNPVASIERHPTRLSGDIEVFSPDEVWALVKAAKSEQDGALFLTAAFTGLRMGELIALRWRDIDFDGSVVRVRLSRAAGALTTPKSGKVRSVPLAPDVAQSLRELSERERFSSPDDLVFVGDAGTFLDNSALRRRYKAALKRAGLRQLRFHEYADVGVMPTLAEKSLRFGLIAA